VNFSFRTTMTTIGTWGLKLTPGKPYKFNAFPIVPGDDLMLRISYATLGETLADEGRTVVKITKTRTPMDGGDDDEDEDAPSLEEHVLCSLIPGKIEQVAIGVEFSSDLIQFEVIGKNEVHLLGNWIDTAPNDVPPFGSDDDDDDDDEDSEYGYRLQDVSSDVELNPSDVELDDTDGSRFEEVTSGSKGAKRPADAMDEDVVATDGLSKKQKKKLAKKLKNAEGNGVATSVASVASAQGSPDAKKKEKKDKKAGAEKENKEGGEKEKGETKTLAGGLAIRDAKTGTGKSAKKGDQLSMRYIGKLENGKIFDKNTGGSPFRFRLGQGEVIKGWDQGLVGMQVGGERVLTIPANLGYGAKGAKPDIPPNATLRFEVKLIDIK